MARKVKCQITGEYGTNETFFCVRVNNKNKYYKSEEIYKKKQQEKEKKEILIQILHKKFELKRFNTLIPNLVKDLMNEVDINLLCEVFKYKSNDIDIALSSVQFPNLYNKTQYVKAIILNSVEEYELLQTNKEKEKNQVIDIDSEVYDLNFENKTKEHISDISDLI